MSEGMFSAIRISGSGLRGQRTKMDVVARNLANAETTRTADGTPYRRQRAIFKQVLGERMGMHNAGPGRNPAEFMMRTDPRHMVPPTGVQDGLGGPDGLDSSVDVAPDSSEFRVVYDPGHPDADAEGYVLMPNVNPVTEMVDMITASRAYEANVGAVQAAKDMFNDALKI